MNNSQLTSRIATVADAPAIVEIYNAGIADRIATFETSPRSVDQILGWFDDRHPTVVVIDEGGIRQVEDVVFPDPGGVIRIGSGSLCRLLARTGSA